MGPVGVGAAVDIGIGTADGVDIDGAFATVW